MTDDPIVLTRFADPVRAELARDRLEAAGITARLGNFEASEMISAAAAQGVELLVPSADAARAAAVLAEIERESHDPAVQAAMEAEAVAQPPQ